jgi:4-hydroxybenzoate polyprenyltransferase
MSSWKETLGAVAPALAAALGGPLAGAAVGVIAKALGVEASTTDELSSLIGGATPEQLLLLKNADNDFVKSMKELEIEDRKSARTMAQTIGSAPQMVLSAIYSVGYFLMLYALVNGGVTVPDGLKDSFTMLLGVMTAAQAQIMNFWFGSSSGSKDKTKKLRG